MFNKYLLIILIAGLALPAHAAMWKIETIDGGAQVVGQSSSIALDKNDLPHVSYYDASNKRLKYAKRADNNWTLKVVDYPAKAKKTWSGAAWNTANWKLGEYNSIDIDTNGNPHIAYSAYYNENNQFPMYSYWIPSTGTWPNEQIYTGTGPFNTNGKYISLALDAKNIPHLCFYDSGNKNLGYYQGGIGYSFVDVQGEVGEYSSIAVDSSDRAYISYYAEKFPYPAEKTKKLKFTWWKSSYQKTNILGEKSTEFVWVKADGIGYQGNDSAQIYKCFDVADQSADVGKYTAIAIDTLSRPHISYYDQNNKALKYAKWTGVKWETVLVDSSGSTGKSTSLALDNLGKPHISYYDEANKTIKYARYIGAKPPEQKKLEGSWGDKDGSGWKITDAGWFIQTVAAAGEWGYTSIAIDSHNLPHITYYDAAGKSLKYATILYPGNKN